MEERHICKLLECNIETFKMADASKATVNFFVLSNSYY